MPVASMSRGEYSLLELWPDRITIGVILHDPESGMTRCRLRDDWDEELAPLLENDLNAKFSEPGSDWLAWMEETVSNTLLLSDREAVNIGGFRQTLDRLFSRHVQPMVPLWSLYSAAGPFQAEQSPEPEGWVKVPPGIRLTEDHFAAHITGRSMEPLIPDGSTCLFRSGVTGTRDGRLVLVEEIGAVGDRFTVKRYRSRKVKTYEDEWRHAAITLESLNPEFPSFDLLPDEDRYRIVAEFVQVLN